jgi:hypothetical protein
MGCHEEEAIYLINKGADVNARNVLGIAPLHFLTCPYPRILEAYLSAGADINAQDNDGRTPLMSTMGYPDTTENFIKAGASVNLTDKRGRTALDYALKIDTFSKEIVAVLKSAGAVSGKSQSNHRSFDQSPVPQFKDYPASQVYKGPNARVVLSRADLNYKTRLREAAKNEKPNFAGHYILTSWGCGTECLQGAVIDARTGKVYWWDFTICCWGATDDKFNPIEFRPESKLIVFSGQRNEKEGDDGAHFYRFENGRFVHLRSIPTTTR